MQKAALILLIVLLVQGGLYFEKALETNRVGLRVLERANDVSISFLCGLGDEISAEPIDYARLSVSNRLQGQAAWFDGNCETAIALWERASTNDHDTSLVRYFLSLAYVLKGQPLKAHDLYNEFPGSMERPIYLVQRVLFSERADNRLQWLEIDFWVNPSRVTVRRLQENLPEERSTEIENYYQELVKLVPNDTFDHWWAVGYLAEKEANWLSACDAYQRASGLTTLESDKDLALHALARVFERSAQPECIDVDEVDD